MTKRSRRSRGSVPEESFGMSLMDLLTAALGSVLFIFIIYTIVMNADLRRFVTTNADLIKRIKSLELEVDRFKKSNKLKNSEIESLLAQLGRVKGTLADGKIEREQWREAIENWPFYGGLKVAPQQITLLLSKTPHAESWFP